MTLFILGLKQPIYNIGGKKSQFPQIDYPMRVDKWFLWTMTRCINQFQKSITYLNDNIFSIVCV